MYKKGVSSSNMFLDAFCGDLVARLALFFAWSWHILLRKQRDAQL